MVSIRNKEIIAGEFHRENKYMLIEPTITPFLTTVKPKESKSFFLNILGLKLISEDDFALEFEGNGVFFKNYSC